MPENFLDLAELKRLDVQERRRISEERFLAAKEAKDRIIRAEKDRTIQASLAVQEEMHIKPVILKMRGRKIDENISDRTP